MYNAIWILNVIAVLLLFAILVITIISMLKRNSRQKIEARAMAEAEKHNKRNYMIISGLTEDYELLINVKFAADKKNDIADFYRFSKSFLSRVSGIETETSF